MAIDLEVKHRLQAIEARLKALEDRPQSIVTQETLVELAKLEALNRQEQTKPEVRALCPHCKEKPNHFFHVRSCLKKNKNNDDRNRDPSSP
jgi:hypothetical protein